MRYLILMVSIFFVNLAQAAEATVCKPQEAAKALRKSSSGLDKLDSIEPHWLMVKRAPEQIPGWLKAQHVGALNRIIINTMQYNALLSGCTCNSLKEQGLDFELELYKHQRSDTDELKGFLKSVPNKIELITRGAKSC